MTKVRIAVLDTDIHTTHPIFNGIKLKVESTKFTNSIKNHATAVCSMIIKDLKDVQIYVFPIFNEVNGIEINTIIDTLQYIYYNLDVDIINMSFGTTSNSDIDLLHQWCNKLAEKGVIIVSAYENGGALSYPACFDSVIGVDISSSFSSIKQYNIRLNSKVDIIACGCPVRVAWEGEKYILATSTSFITGYFTGKIGKIIMETGITKKDQILKKLKESETKTCEDDLETKNEMGKQSNLFNWTINSAVVFPLNKEILVLLRERNLLEFEILHVYDTKYGMKVGKYLKDILDVDLDENNVIENIENINWNDTFDTFILGHSKEISNSVGQNYIEKTIEMCITYKKNLYAFDDLSNFNNQIENMKNEGLFVYYPSVENNLIVWQNNNRLWQIESPVIGVFGTSSKQGKFTTQIKLKEQLSNMNYDIGFLGSEPASYLFNADEVYAFGYGTNIDTNGNKSVTTINDKLHHIDKKSKDAIIVGCQSGLVPYDYVNLNRLTFPQMVFLQATVPDVVVLCVNPHDPIEYIIRTIQYIESSTESKVVCLCVYPIKLIENSIGCVKKIDLSKLPEYDTVCKKIEINTNKKTLKMQNDMYSQIANIIIDCLS